MRPECSMVTRGKRRYNCEFACASPVLYLIALVQKTSVSELESELNSTTETVSAPVLQASAPQVLLKPRRALPLFAQHPWVFQGAIHHVKGDPQPGDAVRLTTD